MACRRVLREMLADPVFAGVHRGGQADDAADARLIARLLYLREAVGQEYAFTAGHGLPRT
jgi:hypothetical protein